MTERELHNTGNTGDTGNTGEAELVSALRRRERTTSARHDETVLSAARSAAAARGRERRRARWSLRIGASLSAALIAAVAIVWLVPSRQALDETPLRGSRVVVSPANGAALEAPPRAFEWPAQQGAAAYRLVLLDARAQPVWQSEPSPEHRVVVPESVARRLAGGGTWLWMVEIRDGGGGRELGPFFFDVAATR